MRVSIFEHENNVHEENPMIQDASDAALEVANLGDVLNNEQWEGNYLDGLNVIKVIYNILVCSKCSLPL